MIEHTLQLHKKIIGDDDPLTLASMHSLANIYRATGRTPEALELIEDTVQLRKKTLDDDHPWTITSMGLTAICL